MSIHRPTASVTGQQEWEWNRLQAQQESRTASPGSTAGRSDEPRLSEPRRERREPRDPPQREVAQLEAELERKERRLQSVIDQYEQLLREKNQQLRTRNRSDPHAASELPLVSKICQYVDE